MANHENVAQDRRIAFSDGVNYYGFRATVVTLAAPAKPDALIAIEKALCLDSFFYNCEVVAEEVRKVCS